MFPILPGLSKHLQKDRQIELDVDEVNTTRWVADKFNLFLSKVGPEQGLL